MVNPRLTLLCRDREVRHDPSCRDVAIDNPDHNLCRVSPFGMKCLDCSILLGFSIFKLESAIVLSMKSELVSSFWNLMVDIDISSL